jgi:hypothetical protein
MLFSLGAHFTMRLFIVMSSGTTGAIFTNARRLQRTYLLPLGKVVKLEATDPSISLLMYHLNRHVPSILFRYSISIANALFLNS